MVALNPAIVTSLGGVVSSAICSSVCCYHAVNEVRGTIRYLIKFWTDVNRYSNNCLTIKKVAQFAITMLSSAITIRIFSIATRSIGMSLAKAYSFKVPSQGFCDILILTSGVYYHLFKDVKMRNNGPNGPYELRW